MNWIEYDCTDCYAIAIYNYSAQHPLEMNLRIGDFLIITQQNPGWYAGYMLTDPCTKKAFPQCCVRKIPHNIYPLLWSELYSFIPNIRQVFMSLANTEFNQAMETVEDVLTENSLDYFVENPKMSEQNKRILMQKLENCKRILGLPIEYQNDKIDKLNLTNVSVLSIYSHHQKVVESSRNTSSQLDGNSGNLCIYLKMISINFERNQTINEKLEVVTCLYKQEESNKCAPVKVSESYTLGIQMTNAQIDLYKETPIVIKDVQYSSNCKYFLVFQFIRIGPMRPNKDSKGSYRRPKGVAVMDITESIMSNKFEVDRQLGISLSNRDEDYLEKMSQQLIKDNRVNRQNFRCFFNVQLRSIKPAEITDREIVLLGLNPNFPSTLKNQRNCLYLTLDCCDIDRGRKTADPNFEVEISIRNAHGENVPMMKDCWREFKTQKSVVYYHCAKPQWSEVLCAPLFGTVNEFPKNIHFRFVIWHRSLNDKGFSGNEKPLGVAYLKFFPYTDSYTFLSSKENDNIYKLNVMKMDMAAINQAKYLEFEMELHESQDNLNSNVRKQSKVTHDIISVQTLLCSGTYTTDYLLGSLCFNSNNREQLLQDMTNKKLTLKRVDDVELQKFSIKLLESCLKIIETRGNSSEYLCVNLMALLAEMFKGIKNLPEYQNRINRFIVESMSNNVFNQILHCLVNYTNEKLILETAEWFMKIVVKSFKVYQNSPQRNAEQDDKFQTEISNYLIKLEKLSASTDPTHTLIRKLVMRKAGPIISALVQKSDQRNLAVWVDHLLRNCDGAPDIMTSELTMEVIKLPMFYDADCRAILLPKTTRNILEMFRLQIQRISKSREDDHDHLLDNICEDLVAFMSAHEAYWEKCTVEAKNYSVKSLLFDNEMLREINRNLGRALEFMNLNDSHCKLVQKPTMVLLSVFLTCLRHISETLWQEMLQGGQQMVNCELCELPSITDGYDLADEIVMIIHNLQNLVVFPSYMYSAKEDSSNMSQYNDDGLTITTSDSVSTMGTLLPGIASFSSSALTQSRHKSRPRPWFDMLFVQSLYLLRTMEQLHIHFVQPYIIPALTNSLIRGVQPPDSSQGPVNICSCHPSATEMAGFVRTIAICKCDIVCQSYLALESLPNITARRFQANAPRGDLRLAATNHIIEFWNSLDFLKIEFANTFFPIFANLTTIRNYEIRLIAVKGMLDIVHLNRDSMKLELITQIDKAMEKANDETYFGQMSRAFKEAIGPLRYEGDDVSLVDDIIRQMSNIEECSQHLSDASPFNAMIVIHNLRLFYQSSGRSDIIDRYLVKLASIHSKTGNNTEMGYTLLERSSFYKWTCETIPQNMRTQECDQQITQYWQLKSSLLENSLGYFEKEDWEQGIEVCKELIDGYQNHIIDFVKLSKIHLRMADLIRRIMYEDRQEPYFYLVAYLGSGYPKFISELPKRCLVIRSNRISRDFEIDLKCQFKDAKVQTGFAPNLTDPTNTQNKSKQIYYCSVRPYQINVPDIYKDKPIKQRILRYYESYKIRKFVYKTLKSPEEDAMKRIITGSIITTSCSLPHILSIAPVSEINDTVFNVIAESIIDLKSKLNRDKMTMEDYEAIEDNTKRAKWNQKMIDCIQSYFSPVAGGIKKIVEMVTDADSKYFDEVANLVRQALDLIYGVLSFFDICEKFEDYKILVEYFDQTCNYAAEKLDMDFDDLNSFVLISDFKQHKGTVNIRRPSIFSRNVEEKTIIGRRPVHNLDENAEDNSDWFRSSFAPKTLSSSTTQSYRPRLPSTDGNITRQQQRISNISESSVSSVNMQQAVTHSPIGGSSSFNSQAPPPLPRMVSTATSLTTRHTSTIPQSNPPISYNSNVVPPKVPSKSRINKERS